MKIFNVLSDKDIKSIKDAISQTNWVDGKLSAVGAAKEKKDNLQISADNDIFKQHIQPILNRVHKDPVITPYTFINELIDPRLAMYRKMGKYDWHVDVSILAFKRTDLSWTICLNDSDEYEGGELEIKSDAQSTKIKLKAGQMVVYPSGLLHKVNEVTSGERLVIVGWINSHVKLHEHRERLYNFFLELNNFRNEYGPEKTDNLNQIYHQLVRDYTT